jgi:hypothetical protein
MKNVTVFYHVWQAPGWQLLFQQQIMNMYVSGLYDAANTIYVCCNGEESLPFDNTKLVIKRNTRKCWHSTTQVYLLAISGGPTATI